ncbi:uncharacterized protein LOC111302834 [Durio zibethinus]|uniref:Uncharacterized protein LOC111302834 n=1 Tax=Durio zibethinus TaxID=66656 RepID=A0A6P5ZPX2_DURZI|nr:uncharacterized protein LOC111302834 [Durio zibethinus]XP_022754426.1 uncharacterized protein LOC111302834 [Durio zibethinus]
MELLVGPTFSIEVAASATYVRDGPQEKISSSCLYLKEDDVGFDDSSPGSDRVSSYASYVSSESSSSIGSLGDSDDEVEEGVVSSGGRGGLASLRVLEDSLPIKRGLSNHYAGKSKSFANLLDISSVKELHKAENPFNKRRRVLIANKWSSRKSSFYSWQNLKSMPLLAWNEDDEDGEDKETPSSNDKLSVSVAATKPRLQQSKLKATFKPQSCFSLADLQVERL